MKKIFVQTAINEYEEMVVPGVQDCFNLQIDDKDFKECLSILSDGYHPVATSSHNSAASTSSYACPKSQSTRCFTATCKRAFFVCSEPGKYHAIQQKWDYNSFVCVQVPRCNKGWWACSKTGQHLIKQFQLLYTFSLFIIFTLIHLKSFDLQPLSNCILILKFLTFCTCICFNRFTKQSEGILFNSQKYYFYYNHRISFIQMEDAHISKVFVDF